MQALSPYQINSTKAANTAIVCQPTCPRVFPEWEVREVLAKFRIP